MTQPNPAAFAFAAVKLNLSANEALRQYREGGGAIRRETWLRLYSQARAAGIIAATEAALPLTRMPLATEIRTLDTKTARGWVQYADVYVRDADTGEVTVHHWALRGTSLLSREAVIERAMNKIAESATHEGTLDPGVVIGAVYTGTYQMVPRPEAEAA